MNYNNHLDLASEDVPQQEGHTTEPASSWAEQVEINTAGMGGSSVVYPLQVDDDIAGVGPTNNTEDLSNLDLDHQANIPMNGHADYYVVGHISQPITGVMGQTYVPPVVPVLAAVPVAPETPWRGGGPGQSNHCPSDGSANWNSMSFGGHGTQIFPDPFFVSAASGLPWASATTTTPMPCFRIDSPNDDSIDTSMMDPDSQTGQTSPSIFVGSVDYYCNPFPQQEAMYEEQNAASDFDQDVAQVFELSEYLRTHADRVPGASWSSGATPLEGPMQSLSLERASTSRRSSCVSAPGNLEDVQDVAPSPTPSEISVTPTAYPDPLLCEIDDCQAEFTGEYRRGNQLRHKRLVHNAAKFPCGARNCNRLFNRQDARLKHRRKYHKDEFTNLKPPSTRKNRKPSRGLPRSQDDLGF